MRMTRPEWMDFCGKERDYFTYCVGFYRREGGAERFHSKNFGYKKDADRFQRLLDKDPDVVRIHEISTQTIER